MRWKVCMVVSIALMSTRLAVACPSVSFFAEPCEEEPEETRPTPPPLPPAPLFTKETVARDTPPVLLQMLQEPAARTPEQARLFVAHQQERQRIMFEVQQLIQAATPPRPQP